MFNKCLLYAVYQIICCSPKMHFKIKNQYTTMHMRKHYKTQHTLQSHNTTLVSGKTIANLRAAKALSRWKNVFTGWKVQLFFFFIAGKGNNITLYSCTMPIKAFTHFPNLIEISTALNSSTEAIMRFTSLVSNKNEKKNKNHMFIVCLLSVFLIWAQNQKMSCYPSYGFGFENEYRKKMVE